MWNCSYRYDDRPQRIETALKTLEDAQTAIFDEYGPGDYEKALTELERLSTAVEIHVKRYREAMTRPDMDQALRVEALGQALRLIRIQFGA